MWKILGALVFLLLVAHNYLLSFLAHPVSDLHNRCVELMRFPSAYDGFYKAIVCGADLTNASGAAAFKNTGLYHLIVVSGSHFVFLEALLMPIAKRSGRFGSIVVFLILIVFCLACRLSPPVVRAFASFMLRKASLESKLFWRGRHITLVSGMLTLAAFPQWLDSLSFLLSWSAALLISVPDTKSWRKHFLIYVGLLPLLLGLQPLHPVSVLMNWIAGPIIGTILFPLSMAAMLLPPLHVVSDPLWMVIIRILDEINMRLPSTHAHSQLHKLWCWLYMILLHLFIFYRAQNKAAPSKD